MVGKFGHSVESLLRVSFGGVTLEGISKPGDLATLSEKELTALGLRVVEAVVKPLQTLPPASAL